MAEYVYESAESLRKKIMAVLTGVGMPKDSASQVADGLLDAESSNVESHGLMRLKSYTDRILAGNINVHPDMKLKTNGIVGNLDGDNGMGQVVTNYAVDECIKMAKEHGIAMITVHNSNHFGTVGYYTNKMAKAGCIGMAATMAGPLVAPYGGNEKILGTDPLAISYPAKKQVFCIDMATSAVSMGKIKIYASKGKAIPESWALDTDGNVTTDANKATKGALLPLGGINGYKGYGLGMAMEALCSLISGANLSCESVSMFQPGAANTGHFICAIDIEHFLPLEQFKQRAQDWFDKIKASQKREGMTIQIPGEPEDSYRAKAAAGMIPVLKSTMTIVDEYVAKYGK